MIGCCNIGSSVAGAPLGSLPREECVGRWFGSFVQSILFRRDHYSKQTAIKWALDHGFAANKVDVTKNYLRVRQFDPELCGCFGMNTRPIKGGTLRLLYCGWPREYPREHERLMIKAGVDQKKSLSATGKARRLAAKIHGQLNPPAPEMVVG